MQIICAGLPKTGTKSLAAALKILGFTVHDYEEHLEYYMDQYIQAFSGTMPNFAAMYSNIDATLDDPSCFFWRELKETFPDAKVILMKRDNVESWLKSVLHTHAIWKATTSQVCIRLSHLMTPTGRKFRKMSDMFEKIMKFDKGIKVTSTVYLEHNARVETTIPRDELLVYNVKQGWKPLCEFLGAKVPDVPFPRLNVNSAAIPDIINQSVVAKRMFNELVWVLAIMFIFLADIVSDDDLESKTFTVKD